MNEIKIKELFKSIQGEGRYIGYKQLFIRFCGCNLKCKYCDTDYIKGEDCIKYTPQELSKILNSCNDIHSVALTGGEPLLNVDFLKELLPLTDKKIYLETNATLYNELSEIKPYINIVSADIKLESATGFNTFELHKKFFENCIGIETFAKIVFNNNITNNEIKKCSELASTYNLELILQPEMKDNCMKVSSEYSYEVLNKFLLYYDNVRLIPQVHKFLNLR